MSHNNLIYNSFLISQYILFSIAVINNIIYLLNTVSNKVEKMEKQLVDTN